MYNNTSSSYDKNDYIFSYPIYLKKNETVTVKYHAAIGSDDADPATLKLAVATAQDKDNIIANLASDVITSKEYKEFAVDYKADKDAVYYFGFGNATPKVTTTTSLRVDNVSFSQKNLAVKDISKSSIKIYPNPVTDYLNVKSDASIKSVEIYSFDGKLLRKTNGNESKIDFRSFPKGSYLVNVQSEQSVISQKIIK